jgi:hypothetical protein
LSPSKFTFCAKALQTEFLIPRVQSFTSERLSARQALIGSCSATLRVSPASMWCARSAEHRRENVPHTSDSGTRLSPNCRFVESLGAQKAEQKSRTRRT